MQAAFERCKWGRRATCLTELLTVRIDLDG